MFPLLRGALVVVPCVRLELLLCFVFSSEICACTGQAGLNVPSGLWTCPRAGARLGAGGAHLEEDPGELRAPARA